MSIKPIDLQVNISHIPEIAKGEHGKTSVMIEGQHLLEKNAKEHALRIKEKLEENKQAEKTVIMREDNQQNRKRGKSDKDQTDEESEKNPESSIPDDKKGTMIDLKR